MTAKGKRKAPAGARYFKKSGGVLCRGNVDKYKWIHSHSKEFSVQLMCQCLRVCRSSYYDWRASTPSQARQSDERLGRMIEEIFTCNRSIYGARRIKICLEESEGRVSRRRIGRVMKQRGLCCQSKKRFRRTTDSGHRLPVADNLLNRCFVSQSPNRCYVGDITYIYTESGWLYLAVVIDLYSRKVVGWSMSDHMKADLVNQALLMALCRRQPKPGLLWHTDRGSQYASESHRRILRQYGIIQSMSRKGNCWDNAVSESFFHTLKVECVHRNKFHSKQEAKQTIFEYIEVFYNRIRIHSANQYLSPVNYENIQN